MRQFERATEGDVYEFPTFIHTFLSYWQHDFEYPQAHSRPGRLYAVVDLVLLRARRWLNHHDAVPSSRIAGALVTFLWGLNCGFPALDIALYTVWYLRGCAPLKVWRTGELLEALLLKERQQYRVNFEGDLPPVLQNLGLLLDVSIGWRIYELQNDLPLYSLEYPDPRERDEDDYAEERKKSFMDQALRGMAYRSLEVARRMAPIDTGALRRSIGLSR